MLNKILGKKQVDYSDSLIKFIHIGSPKCASTSFQKHLFNNETNCQYLGGGINGNVFQYADDIVKRFAEIDLRYSNSHSFDLHKHQAHFTKIFESAKSNESIRSCGLSYEAFSFTYGAEIDVETKAKRLSEVFGRDAKIIYLIRNQKSLYTSLYGEHVREGYHRSFDAFLDYSWVFRHRNWFHDFDFHRVYNIYKKYFDDVIVLPFEELKKDPTSLVSKIQASIGGVTKNLSIPVDNAKMSDQAIELLREYNTKTPYALRNDLYKPFHIHRYAELLDNPRGSYLDYAQKDLMLQLSMVDLANQINHRIKSDFKLTFPEELSAKFKECYAPGNAKLSKLAGLNLKDYGYWV